MQAARKTLQSARQAWKAADTDHDRKLSAAEWTAANAKAAFADVDEDKDGFVTPRETIRWVRANGGQSPF